MLTLMPLALTAACTGLLACRFGFVSFERKAATARAMAHIKVRMHACMHPCIPAAAHAPRLHPLVPLLG